MNEVCKSLYTPKFITCLNANISDQDIKEALKQHNQEFLEKKVVAAQSLCTNDRKDGSWIRSDAYLANIDTKIASSIRQGFINEFSPRQYLEHKEYYNCYTHYIFQHYPIKQVLCGRDANVFHPGVIYCKQYY